MSISDFCDEKLDLDRLIDLLCDYRHTVKGDCPIVFQYGDSASYALAAGLIHAAYISATEADGAKESALLKIVPLGDDLSGWPAEQQPRLALCLRPYVTESPR